MSSWLELEPDPADVLPDGGERSVYRMPRCVCCGAYGIGEGADWCIDCIMEERAETPRAKRGKTRDDY